jgi:hypothetical protein
MLIIFLNLRPTVKKYYKNYKKELKKDILNYLD